MEERGAGARAEYFQVVVHVSAETLECDTCDDSSHGGPAAPEAPALSGKPVRKLGAQHGELGIEIDAWTATPDREGDCMDVDRALFTLR